MKGETRRFAAWSKGLVRGFDREWKARAFLAAIGTLVFFFPFSLFFVAGGFLPARFGWMSSAIIMLTGAATLLAELRSMSVRAALARFLGLAGILFIVEYAGVNTGLPFGAYAYTDELGLIVVGIPLAISIAWYCTVVNAWRIAEYLVSGLKLRGPLVISLLAGILTLGLDLALEPTAGFVQKYWVWESNEVPLQNYLSWFALSVMAVYLLARTGRGGREDGEVRFRVAVFLFGFHFVLFVLTTLVNGYLLVAGIALAVGSSPFALLANRIRLLRPDPLRR
jgi:uncharacterized membrane protein